MFLQNLELCDKFVLSVNDPWFESVYEFELVNLKFLNTYKGNKDGRKRRTIKAPMKRDKIDMTFLFVMLCFD